MHPQPSKNTAAAIRVSTMKQGTDSDSPDAQKEQIERFAKTKGITIKKFFVFMESASKEQQPMPRLSRNSTTWATRRASATFVTKMTSAR